MGSQRVRCDLVTKQWHIIRRGFHHWGNDVLTISYLLSKKKKAYLDITKKYETMVFSSSNYEIYERQTQKGERLYWVGHGALEDLKTVSQHIQRFKSSLAWQKVPKRCNRQLAENHYACEQICHLKTECYDIYKAVGGIGSAYQQVCHAQRTRIRKIC